MTEDQISFELRRIATNAEFAQDSADLVEEWTAKAYGAECIEPVLRFMEDYPKLDFGSPGALVHFIERFHGKGYEERLVASVKRRPTSHTIWMLNRLTNGTGEEYARRHLIEVMREAMVNPLTDENTRRRIERFLSRLSTY